MSTLQYKLLAKWAGVFFILAAVSSITAVVLYHPLVGNPAYFSDAPMNFDRIVLGAVNELILIVSMAGTAITFYPILTRYNASWGMGYVAFRLLEAVFIMIGTVAVLSALSVSVSYASGSLNDSAKMLSDAFLTMYRWCFTLGPNFMLAVSTFSYSYVFFKSGFIPRFHAGFGLFASLLILIVALLVMFGVIEQLSAVGLLLALPIFLFEMSLAARLVFKGFESSALH